MEEQFSRTKMLIGKDGIEKLRNSRVIVFGIGGVGGYIVEALIRSGLGSIDIVDNDTVSLSNINRQIIATHNTIGEYKIDVAEKRILSINPNVKVTKHKIFFMPETKSQIDFSQFDYIVDAIDTVSGKIAIIEEAKKLDKRVISSMGTGNKIDPTKFEVADISKTSVCPLARVMRQELKKRKIINVKVLFSKEPPAKAVIKEGGKRAPASIAFVPSVAGMIIAGEVIKDLISD